MNAVAEKKPLSDAVIQKLAELIDPDMMAELVATANNKEFNAELAERITQARQTIERKPNPQAQAGVVAQGAEDIEPLTEEQCGEWLRCRIGRFAGMSVTPNPKLDREGRISQLLGHSPVNLNGDGRLVQAIGPTVGSAGGYAVPTDMIMRIGVKAERAAVLWNLVSKYPTKRQSGTLPVEGTVGDLSEGSAAKSGSATSSDEVAETSLTMAEKTFTMRYADARVRMKLDMLDDSPLAIMEFVTRVIGRQFSYRRENRIATGNGTSMPMGLVHNSGVTAGITSVSIGAAISLAKIVDLIGELPEEYAANATAVMHRKTKLAAVKELAENVRSVQFLLDVIPPLKASPYIPKGQILVGDFSYYVVPINTEMMMLSDVLARHFAMDIVFVEKWDGFVEQTDAFRLGTGITYS